MALCEVNTQVTSGLPSSVQRRNFDVTLLLAEQAVEKTVKFAVI